MTDDMIETRQATASHPAWCQADHCTINPDGSVTHVHRFGEVAGFAVEVRRTDRTDDNGRVQQGRAQTFAGDLSMTELDALRRLAEQAAAFAGQRRGGGL